jgi:hypothetical protein
MKIKIIRENLEILKIYGKTPFGTKHKILQNKKVINSLRRNTDITAAK